MCQAIPHNSIVEFYRVDQTSFRFFLRNQNPKSSAEEIKCPDIFCNIGAFYFCLRGLDFFKHWNRHRLENFLDNFDRCVRIQPEIWFKDQSML